MKTSLVSIIIPTYNRAHLIGETLESVLAQTYQNWECIVVDDGSADATNSLLTEYTAKDPRFRFIQRDDSHVKGASSCRNIGLADSKGAYCLFLDSDDWLLEHCLMQRVSYLHSNPEIDFVVVSMGTKTAGALAVNRIIPESDDYLIDFLSYKLYWGIMCTLWKRELLLQMNGFNPYYPRLNDPELHIRGMLESKGRFHVANRLPVDSVYRMEEVKKGKVFGSKYNQSLQLFFRDMVHALQKHERLADSVYLKKYLLDYLLHFSYCVPLGDNLRLIRLSKQLGIISFKQLLVLLLWSATRVFNFKIPNYINAKLNLIIHKTIKI